MKQRFCIVDMGTKPMSTALILFVLAFGSGVARAQASCPADFCENPIQQICDDGGFLITLLDFDPAETSDNGFASYTYQICSPSPGTCSLDAGRSCLSHEQCAQHGAGTCNRECAVDSFRGLSHFDVSLAGLSCLSGTTGITGSCTGGPFSVGPDGSCGGIFVAKCDETELDPGECLEMTIQIPGEENGPGLGAAFVVSKESGDCNSSCIEGPSCDPCDRPPDEIECLTRTPGFWGTHPHITEEFLPVTICGEALTITDAGSCDSATEALCVSPGRESRGNQQYAQLVRQLTAAKLNLAASQANGVFCGEAIETRIGECEALCGASKKAISASGCIEDLAAFNESMDGLIPTPPPFDSPGPADSRQCRQANGNGTVIGKPPSCN